MKIHSKHTSPLYRKSFRYSLLFLFLAIVFCNSSSAQSISLSDLKTVDVQSLSDSQISEIIRQVESRGLTQDQVETLVRSQGVSESQIQALRTRIANFNRQDSGGSTTNTSAQNRSRSLVSGSTSEEGGGNALSGDDLKIFGMDLFRRSGMSFSPKLNVPTPVNYELGVGDELIVDLWGEAQQFFKFTVSPEGTIRPKNLGPVYVNGLTIEKATSRLIDRLSQAYRGLKGKDGQDPSIFYQVSLGNIRTINVEVIGSVEQAGVYSLPSLVTLYQALHAAGGPTAAGSMRNIRLVRNNKLLTSVDLYSYITEGIRLGDLRLKDGDVIVVPKYDVRVSLKGEFRTNGLFELKEGETFEDLLKYADGFGSNAFSDVVTVTRKGRSEMELLDVSHDRFADFVPANGDVIQAGGILSRFANRVVLKGAVLRGGEYQLIPGMTVKGLVDKGGGLRGDVFLTRATIYRVSDDFTQTLIPVNLEGIMSGTSPDIELMREDIVNINSIFDLKEEAFVQVVGEVDSEGIYPFFEGMTIKDLVVLAGGYKASASGGLIEISRRVNNSDPKAIAEIISLELGQDLSLSTEHQATRLEPYDQVYIHKTSNYVIQEQMTIEGEIASAGVYTISRKDERISDIIKRAGGTTDFAFLEGAILIRKNEFSNNDVGSFVNERMLEELRKKILSGESNLKANERSKLIERIDLLKATASNSNQMDLFGNRFRRESINDLSEQDSLVSGDLLNGREPVAIKLDKILANPGSHYDLIVKPGDYISIPGQLETVRVVGEVTSPLNVKYDKSYSFKQYIERSGGFLHTAKKGRCYIQYPNGERKGVSRFLFFKKYPKVTPGSTIVVATKPERKAFGFDSIIASASLFATLALTIDRLSN